MTQYILLIHGSPTANPTDEQWKSFIQAARDSGLFRGGSAVREGEAIGAIPTLKLSDHLAGYMRFDADDEAKLRELLQLHPVVINGGTVELCELPES